MKASTKLLVASLSLPLIAGAGAAVLRMQSNRMRDLFERDLNLPGEDIAMTIGPDDSSAEAGTTSAPLDTTSEDLPALVVVGVQGVGECHHHAHRCGGGAAVGRKRVATVPHG